MVVASTHWLPRVCTQCLVLHSSLIALVSGHMFTVCKAAYVQYWFVCHSTINRNTFSNIITIGHTGSVHSLTHCVSCYIGVVASHMIDLTGSHYQLCVAR